MTISLDHTILEVKHLAESVAFYRDVVGLEARGRSSGFEVMLITPDLALDLDESSEPRQLLSHPYESHWALAWATDWVEPERLAQ